MTDEGKGWWVGKNYADGTQQVLLSLADPWIKTTEKYTVSPSAIFCRS